jgi:hypothetical protein
MEIERGRERGREGGRGESRDCDFFVRAAQGTFVSTPFSPDGGMLVDVEAARRVSSGADAHQASSPQNSWPHSETRASQQSRVLLCFVTPKCPCGMCNV